MAMEFTADSSTLSGSHANGVVFTLTNGQWRESYLSLHSFTSIQSSNPPAQHINPLTKSIISNNGGKLVAAQGVSIHCNYTQPDRHIVKLRNFWFAAREVVRWCHFVHCKEFTVPVVSVSPRVPLSLMRFKFNEILSLLIKVLMSQNIIFNEVPYWISLVVCGFN